MICVNLSKIELKVTSHDASAPLLLVGVLVVLLLGRFCGDIQGRVDDLRDGLDFGAELLLDAVEIVAIFVSDEIDGDT